MIFYGIDPGITGALAVIDADSQVIALHDLPIISDGRTRWVDSNAFASMLIEARQGRPACIYVERAGARPGQGLSSTFCTGVVIGSILAGCQRIAMPLHLVTAATWKASMGLGKDKAVSLDKARLLFPSADLDRKKDHNRGEALCIAEFGRRQYASQGAV